MQTIDAKSGATNYWTEPQGHVAAIKDVEGNTTSATYNELGQRTANSDPDQGAWSFSYDAFGELLSQTDARSAVTTITGRDGLGRITQQQQTPGTAAQMPLGETLQDTRAYDPSNGKGELASVTRRRGYGAPGANTVTWSESYGYETNSARPSTTTTNVPDGSVSGWQSSVTYDGYGRPSTHSYPSGLIVQTQYAPYGHAGAIANYSTGRIYWEVNSEDAWGKSTADAYIDGSNGTYANYGSSGQVQTMSWTRNSLLEDTLTYGYDSFGNLVSQQRQAASASNTESYVYDALQRLTSTTRSIGNAVNYTYSASGNILTKSDNGGTTYVYGGASTGCGPHAVTSANGQTYSCDANGNVTGGSTLSTIWYDADNHPRSITRNGTGTMGWAYDSNGKPSYEQDGSIRRVYGPAGYEVANGVSRHELGPVIVTCSGTNGACGQTSDAVAVALRDRLGSTIDVTDGQSNARAYDAFGKVRNGNMTDKAPATLNLADTIHGFTKHEHADTVQLIHMGGRIYDYQLGRFLNVDPIIGNPASSQSLNPYSYIGNNPLSGVDPTGYQCVGSHIESQTCADTGATATQVATPSVTEQRQNFINWVQQSISKAVENAVARFNGRDSMTPGGAQSTPKDGQPEHIGPFGAAANWFSARAIGAVPNVADYHQRGVSGSMEDWATGFGWSLYNRGASTANGLWDGTPAGMLFPDPIPQHAISDNKQLGGAAAGDVATLVAPLALRSAGSMRIAAADAPAAELGDVASFGPASNAANGPRLAQQLTQQSARSPFTATGQLTGDAIDASKPVPNLGPGQLSNPNIPAGFGKYTTQTFQSPAGNFQAHFYKNPLTGEVYYGQDYKVIFNSMSGVPKQ